MCLDSTMTFFSRYSSLTFPHFTQLYGKFPNMDLVLVIDKEKPLVATISPGGLAASIPGQIAVYTKDKGTQHYTFSLLTWCMCTCVWVCVSLSVAIITYVVTVHSYGATASLILELEQHTVHIYVDA